MTILTRCIKCLKAIMNNKVGLKNLFEHKEALTLLARYVPIALLLLIYIFTAGQ